MKKAGLLLVLFLLAGCAGEKETYPYGLTETEWNSLSIRDQTRLRRDFYFYEKGATAAGHFSLFGEKLIIGYNFQELYSFLIKFPVESIQSNCFYGLVNEI